MKPTRRDFVRLAASATAGAGLLPRLTAETSTGNGGIDWEYRSAFLRIAMAPDQPTFASLSVDSLGQGKLDHNVMLAPPTGEPHYHASRQERTFTYTPTGVNPAPKWSLALDQWSFAFDESSVVIRSTYLSGASPSPLILGFNPESSHATLLGLTGDEGEIALPALLHFPAHGTFRIATATPYAILHYDALRGSENFVRVSFPAATAEQREIEYRLEVTSIYPNVPGIDNDPRYDGYRRDFLSILQLNPRRRALANNSASDACTDTVFEYAMMAARMPPLADGLRGLDLVRQTLDRYIGGMTGYGMKEYRDTPHLAYDFLDSYPSLVIAAAEYVQASHDKVWIERNYSVIKSWANKMIEFDHDGDGLMEYPLTGNSGSWPERLTERPSNWWDTVGFGHKDAYANALSYHAFRSMADLAEESGHASDAELYRNRANKLREAYYPTFYNPATGVLAGWRSADGKLHDYYFLFVSGVAVTYGLVTPEQGNAIWNSLLAKMKDVGYHRFDLGLPGNLVPIRREDYVDLNKIWGGPRKADGSDGFQIYENGGSSACFAYFTIQALRILGRQQEADAILYPMLEGFSRGGFQGHGPDGKTYDWTDWEGNPHGYEGLLVDNYLALLAAAPNKPRANG